MDGDRLILKDRTVIENGTAGLSGEALWLWLPGWTMAGASEKVFDREAMKKVIFQYGDMEDVHVGYTECTNLMKDGNEIAVCMEKG